MTDEIKQLKDAEQKGADAGAERHDEPNMAWVPGLVLIGIGMVFLLNNLTGFELHNWWALFILIPGLGALGNAFRAYRAAGRFTKEAGGSLVGAMAILFTAAIFLFGWSWGAVWPFFLIIAGLGALFGGLFD